MDVNPFLKRLMKAKKEDVIHSSAYGSAQNQGGIGAASSESFQDRMKREKNRTIVRGYGDSQVATSAMGNAPRPKTYTPPAKGISSNSKVAQLGPKPLSTPMPPRNPGISR